MFHQIRMEVLLMPLPRLSNAEPLIFIPDVCYSVRDDIPLLLDIIAPSRSSATLRPAVICIHGYDWFAGTRRGHLEISCCALLAAHGFFTVTIEYRLSGEALFPAQIYDVKAAIRWLRANAAAYAVDPDHIGIWGISAGGHLAALAGLTADLPELEEHVDAAGYSNRVQAVAIGSAPADFLTAGGLMINDAVSPMTQLFGGMVTERSALMRLASPLYHVSSSAPPFLIAHGTLDETVPFEQGSRLYEALVDVGAIAEFIPIEGVYHNWTTEMANIPGRANTWKLGPMALPFFQKHLHA
jgi:acetyl esterase/lipase